MGLIKVAAMNIVRLMDKVPAAHDLCRDTLRELASSLQEVIKRCFVTDDTQIISGDKPVTAGEIDVDLVMINVKKYNQILSSISLSKLVRVEQIKEWCVYIASQIYGVLRKEEMLRKISTEQVGVLLQLPVESIKQLF